MATKKTKPKTAKPAAVPRKPAARKPAILSKKSGLPKDITLYQALSREKLPTYIPNQAVFKTKEAGYLTKSAGDLTITQLEDVVGGNHDGYGLELSDLKSLQRLVHFRVKNDLLVFPKPFVLPDKIPDYPKY